MSNTIDNTNNPNFEPIPPKEVPSLIKTFLRNNTTVQFKDRHGNGGLLTLPREQLPDFIVREQGNLNVQGFAIDGALYTARNPFLFNQHLRALQNNPHLRAPGAPDPLVFNVSITSTRKELRGAMKSWGPKEADEHMLVSVTQKGD